MSELQAEIKAIQTELESICANTNQFQRRLAALVALPDLPDTPDIADIKASLEPAVNKKQRNIREIVLPDFNFSSQPEANSAFKPPSSAPSPRHSPSRSRSTFPDRFMERSPIRQTAVAQPVNQAAQPDAQTPTLQTPTLQNPTQLIRPALQELRAKAEQLNQLSQTQENVLRRLQSIAAQIDQERRKTADNSKSFTVAAAVAANYPQKASATDRPPTQLSLPPTSATPLTLKIDAPIAADRADPIAEQMAEQMANQMSQMLRQRQNHREAQSTAPFTAQSTAPPTAQFEEQVAHPRRSRRRSPLIKRLRRWLFASPSRQERSEALPFTLRETLTLLLGAALTRLLLNLLLVAVPLLVVPVMILLVIPAAIAVHRATTAPQSGLVWGYRLCIILLGLLIGGRLF